MKNSGKITFRINLENSNNVVRNKNNPDKGIFGKKNRAR